MAAKIIPILRFNPFKMQYANSLVDLRGKQGWMLPHREHEFGNPRSHLPHLDRVPSAAESRRGAVRRHSQGYARTERIEFAKNPSHLPGLSNEDDDSVWIDMQYVDVI